jgi:2-keto-4-pentenoate hydratase/2-oxohepta-3-ene-1,7-dioic acid hydratase in catechol pathway
MATVRIPATGQEFRVGKVVCLARNYVDHIRELGNAVPDAPVLFIKPATSIIGNGGQVVIPPTSRDCHHEVELAVLIGRTVKNVAPETAMDCVAGYGVGIDLTLRDVQAALKAKGLPWEAAKGFDTACPLSDFVPAAQVADPHALPIRFSIDGVVKQDATTALMMRKLPEIISFASRLFTLEAGDVILTGTPAGVGPVASGQRLVGEIAGVGRIEVTVA